MAAPWTNPLDSTSLVREQSHHVVRGPHFCTCGASMVGSGMVESAGEWGSWIIKLLISQRDAGGRKNGRTEWIRTTDIHTPSVARYQTALRPDLSHPIC